MGRRTFRRATGALVATTALVAMTALVAVAARSAPVAVAPAGPHVRDDAGHDVRLPAPALRIASLAPHLTELLYEIGAGDRLVAATAYSDYPVEATTIPRIGGLAGIDDEALVAAHVDLVVAWGSGTGAPELARIRRLGIPVFVDEPRTLDDVAATIERLGALTGRTTPAAAVAASFRARVAALRSTYGSRAPVRVFYQVWGDPLMTVGGPQPITRIIELCGGVNVFAALRTPAPTVDVEAVIHADPELIVTALESDDHRADIARWQRWAGVRAVRERHWLFVDPAVVTRPSSRLLVGAERICRAIDAVRASR